MALSLTPGQVRSFRRTVRAHFECHGRDLPWRGTRDPYRIYVSEMMLQQTQVDRVIAKYAAFIRRFPGWRALAAARFDDVLRVWQGLGYNRRARLLHEAAKAVVAEHGGELPATPEALRELPGIGAATAASIAAFAFDYPAVFIETNIRSVFIHHFFGDRHDVADSEILPLVARTLDKRRPSRWYSALMDYGVWVKKRYGNPSRRSRHRVRQPPFEGSDRQIRGRLLRELLARPGLTAAALNRRIADPRERVPRILETLRAEGMVVRRGRRYEVRGDEVRG